jgi:hypothetical protein
VGSNPARVYINIYVYIYIGWYFFPKMLPVALAFRSTTVFSRMQRVCNSLQTPRLKIREKVLP